MKREFDEEVVQNGHTYVHDYGQSGYYGKVDGDKVEWAYPQYDAGPLAAEIRSILPEFFALADKREKEKEIARLRAIDAREAREKELAAMGLCPKCGTFCCGDCGL